MALAYRKRALAVRIRIATFNIRSELGE